MRMRPAADFMRQRNLAYWSVGKALTIDQDAFGRPSVFIGHKTDEVAIILIDRAHTWGKGCLTTVAPLRKL